MEHKEDVKSLLGNAWIKRGEGKLEKADELLDRAKSICGDQDYLSLGRLYHIQMQLEADRGNFAKAIEHELESLSYYRKTQDFTKIGHAQRHLGDLYYNLKQWEKAEEHYKNALRNFGQVTNISKLALANAHRSYALLLERLGRTQEAIKCWKVARSLYGTINLRVGMVEAEKHLAILE